ncbi:MAG: DUF1501 domain-containing protein [Acidobacteriota bacterium]|nr:DUF1501 domain-containing protein [Blastocatellia bacterium]MDW8413379.1 DUF1501 domain-containing protein [Acidobacteriota bacterium]
MTVSRRDFLKATISALSLPLAMKHLPESVLGQTPDRILVVVEMMGGNDGLNTCVPYTDKLYYEYRPSLAIPEAQLLKISDRIGLHPALAKFKERFDKGNVAILQDVGYPEPDLSHFRSRSIFHRADPTTQEYFEQPGWLGKYADIKLAATNNPLSVVNLGDGKNSQSAPSSLLGEKFIPSTINSFELYQFQTDSKYPADRNNKLSAFKKTNFVTNDAEFSFIAETGVDAVESAERLQAGIKKYTPQIEYPNDSLGTQLQMAAKIIAGELGTQIIYTSYGGFDTHANQKQEHHQLLESFSLSVDAFFRDLERLGKADRVLLMSFSEFGRRPRENGSQGTDHGTAGPMFVIGNSVKGGLYGKLPNLAQLDRVGNLQYSIDFRAVYATVLRDWLQVDPTAVLGAQFENLGFIK